jgi:hypothetical protein
MKAHKTGRPKGFKVSEESRRRMAEGQRKRWAKVDQAKISKRTTAQEIDPLGYSEPAQAPIIKRTEAPKITMRARVRSLEAQATALIEHAIGLRRQITQLAQESEA